MVSSLIGPTRFASAPSRHSASMKQAGNLHGCTQEDGVKDLLPRGPDRGREPSVWVAKAEHIDGKESSSSAPQIAELKFVGVPTSLRGFADSGSVRSRSRQFDGVALPANRRDLLRPSKDSRTTPLRH